jgi:hypothetical protein
MPAGLDAGAVHTNGHRRIDQAGRPRERLLQYGAHTLTDAELKFLGPSSWANTTPGNRHDHFPVSNVLADNNWLNPTKLVVEEAEEFFVGGGIQVVVGGSLISLSQSTNVISRTRTEHAGYERLVFRRGPFTAGWLARPIRPGVLVAAMEVCGDQRGDLGR